MNNEFHPRVSIIIPVYNGSNYMRCAIDSALEQDYDNVEVIVINDGSKDTTDEIAKSYGNKIKYFSKENGGVSTALNLGIQNAKGEYISWLSHDDYYLPNKISRQIAELGKITETSKRDKLIPCSGFKVVDLTLNIEKNRILSSPFALAKIDSLKFFYDGRFQHGCSCLIPLEAFNKIGFFNTQLRAVQDYDLWFRLINAGYLFFYISEVLIVSRCHKMQVSVKKKNVCLHEQLKMWKLANRMFYNDIKNASKVDKKIFYKRKFPLITLICIKYYIINSLPNFMIYIRSQYHTIKKNW
jgi:glycosyltransferase involved in cell wall biosynthesis